MVAQMIARVGMGKYDQPVTVKRQPRHHWGKKLGRHSQLARTHGVWTYRTVVEITYGHAEFGVGRRAQRLRPKFCIGIKINVGVVTLDI